MFLKSGRLWSFMLRRMALAQGFLDPIAVFSRLQRFSKPSEIWAPTELLRSGAILQARGLMNSQAIQHNLDWVWPYWAKRQFDPTDDAFIPRAFNIAHINLTHRNWTAIGLPDLPEFPIVDPRGLVTPHYDGWSIDGWILKENEAHLIPSQLLKARQTLFFRDRLAVSTFSEIGKTCLLSRAEVVCEDGLPFCDIYFSGFSDSKAQLVLTLRPYNPEGVSFINEVEKLNDKNGWKVNGKEEIFFDQTPDRHVFSDYSSGDVFAKIFNLPESKEKMECHVGMATAAVLYEIKPEGKRIVRVRVPILHTPKKNHPVSLGNWTDNLLGLCKLHIPEKRFQSLYDAALRTLILHSPGDIYPGPYTYKRFWFRDAAFILNAMLCAGMGSRVERVLDRFSSHQTPTGYFLSQDGEWDSNGEALWIMRRYCQLTNKAPKPEWLLPVSRGGRWIKRKRTSKEKPSLHAGLFPAGFSAEHLGPNDFYYWDDFWGIEGLRSAAQLMGSFGETETAAEFEKEADDFEECLDSSIKHTKKRLGHTALPASPYRRMDAGAIGSLLAGYPFQSWSPRDPRLLATADFLIKKCFLKDGFYQEISHSGINAYLTLHVAQVLLRAGDDRFMDLANAIASMATSTGQWPEAIHPRTGGGCMGDGQHVWAAAEWVLLMRNMFVNEEEKENLLVLCSGLPAAWLKKGEEIFFGPTLTAFGEISLTISCGENILVSWEARWHRQAPSIEVRLPGQPGLKVSEGQTSVEIKNGSAQ